MGLFLSLSHTLENVLFPILVVHLYGILNGPLIEKFAPSKFNRGQAYKGDSDSPKPWR